MKRPLIFFTLAGLLASCATKPVTTAETPAPAPVPKKEEVAPVQPVANNERRQTKMDWGKDDQDLPGSKEFQHTDTPAPRSDSTVRITPPIEPKETEPGH